MNLEELLNKITELANNNGTLVNSLYNSGSDNEKNDSRVRIENYAIASKNSIHILELGFNAGHSAATFLAANQFLTMTCVDDCSKSYTKPCFEYIKSLFGERIKLIECKYDELTTNLDKAYFKKFDSIHLNGPEENNQIVKDTITCLRYAKDHCNFIFNGTENIITNSWLKILLNTNVFTPSKLPFLNVSTNKQDVLVFKRPRYAICTVAKGDEYCEKVKNCIMSKYIYADFYGCKLITDDNNNIGDLGIGWHKNFQMRKYIEEYDYLFWIDADAMIMNYNVSPDIMFLFLPSQYNILVSNDPNGLNSGVMLLKNCDQVKLLLDNIPKMDKKYLYTGIYEQLPLMVLKEINFFPNMFYTINQNIWNSYDNAIWRKDIPDFDGYKEGDFIVHFAGYNTWANQQERNLQKADKEFGEMKKFFNLPYDRYLNNFL